MARPQAAERALLAIRPHVRAIISSAAITDALANGEYCAVLTYSLYTVSADTVRLHGTDKLIYTVPFIAYGIFRYMFLLHRRQMGQDTARDLLADKHLLATVGGWLAVTLFILA